MTEFNQLDSTSKAHLYQIELQVTEFNSENFIIKRDLDLYPNIKLPPIKS